MRDCDTKGCTRKAIPSGRWCDACTMVVWRTGRPPDAPPKFVPPWLERARKSPRGLARPLEPAR